jgi:hypothetical protein
MTRPLTGFPAQGNAWLGFSAVTVPKCPAIGMERNTPLMNPKNRCYSANEAHD